MSESFRALCSDFYINQKLSLKLDLPRERQTILDLCDRIRRQFPSMVHFRRVREELALESDPAEPQQRWIAIRNSSVRSGLVNPEHVPDAYALHRHVLEVAPFFLGISPLDVDYLELLFGFDLPAGRNHDAIVFDALIAGTPLAHLLDFPGAEPVDCQPLIGATITESSDPRAQGVEVNFEVKTRPDSRAQGPDQPPEPISIFVTLRKYGPMTDVKALPGDLDAMARIGERLVAERAVPDVIVPIHQAISSGSP